MEQELAEINNRPIKISEQFVKTRTNLLWYSAVLILCFVAQLIDPAISEIKSREDMGSLVQLPIIGIKFQVDILATLIAFASFPTIYNFWFYSKRVDTLHSKGAYTEEFNDIKIILEDYEKKFENWKSQLNTPKNVPDIGEDRFVDEALKRILINKGKREVVLAEYETLILPLMTLKSEIEENYLTTRMVAIEKIDCTLAKAIDNIEFNKNEIESAIQDYNNNLEARDTKVENLIRDAYNINNPVNIPNEKLLLEGIGEINRNFQTLHSSIGESDMFKYKWVDKKIPFCFYSIGLILTLIGYTNCPHLMNNYLLS